MRLATALLGLAIGLVVAELGLRVSGLAPGPALSTVSEDEFGRIPGIFKPGQTIVEQPGTEFEYTVTIDSLGYRGSDFPRDPAPGEVRVLYAGDSFTFGHNVADGHTLPAQLETILTDRCRLATVVNAGISGSTILGQAAMVERGLVLEPDVVVVMYHENDLVELANVRIWEQLAANRRIKSMFPLSIAYWVARNTALGRLALKVRVTLQAREANTRQQADIKEQEIDEARERYAEIFEHLVRRVEAAGVPLAFVAFPHPSSVREPASARDYRWALEQARDLGVPTVDLLRTLAGSWRPLDSLYLLPRDYHPSPEGHALAASEVADLVARLAPSECRTAGRADPEATARR